jgi:hypothetical protein
VHLIPIPRSRRVAIRSFTGLRSRHTPNLFNPYLIFYLISSLSFYLTRRLFGISNNMRGYQKYLSGSVLLATLGGVQAKLDPNSDKNIAIYWGMTRYAT